MKPFKTAESAVDWSKSQRSLPLDCLRAVAIIAVLLFHVSTLYNYYALDVVAQFFRIYGSLGVDIFFPLSGYLICRFLLYQKGRSSIKVFFLRRFFRIIPLYMVAVTTVLVAMVVTGYESDLIDRIWIPYSLLTGWFLLFDGRETVPYTITWSISVEEFAYIVFGLFALLTRRYLPLLLLITAIAPIFLRGELYAADYSEVQFFPLARIDSIALGGLTAWLVTERRWPITVLVLALGVTVLAGQLSESIAEMLIFTVIPLATCIVITCLERFLRHHHDPATAAAASVGYYSYFIYLFHYLVIYGIKIVVPEAFEDVRLFWLVSGIALAITYAMAIISFRFYEGPMMRFGRGLERRWGWNLQSTDPSPDAKQFRPTPSDSGGER